MRYVLLHFISENFLPSELQTLLQVIPRYRVQPLKNKLVVKKGKKHDRISPFFHISGSPIHLSVILHVVKTRGKSSCSVKH